VRYDKGRTLYWEVGNATNSTLEPGYFINTATNLDGQPQLLDGKTYGSQFKVFADSMRQAAAEVGNKAIKIGITLDGINDASAVTYGLINNWNNDVLTAENNTADFFVVQNYYPFTSEDNTAVNDVLSTAVTGTGSMMNWIRSSVLQAGAVQKPVAMDLWSITPGGSQQMVSNIAGLHSVMVLGEALKNQISMTCRYNLAQSWNNGADFGIFNNSSSTEFAEPGAADWNPRPAFYYMYYFQHYMGAYLVNTTSDNDDIISYGSLYSSGEGGVVLVNQGAIDHVVKITFNNFLAGNTYYYFTLNGGTDNIPFSSQVYVNGAGPTGNSGGPANVAGIAASSSAISGGIFVTVPKYGAVFLVAARK
jgi:hypothetical protein